MKPLLMLTLPNSGSTWLAEMIAAELGLNYAMEFFNPVRNTKHQAVLSRQFGCERISCYRNIAIAGDEDGLIDDDIIATWGAEHYNFTKEVFSPFKLAAFVRHFRCFVLLRSAALTFPPTRLRIWVFYECAWHALKERGHPGVSKQLQAMESRAIEAHAIMTARLRADAAWLDVPIIEYEALFADESALNATLARALGPLPDDTDLAGAIIVTRKLVGRRIRDGLEAGQPQGISAW